MRSLFAFASYNAGPNRIQELRREAARRHLDPNRWFRSVEFVVAEKVGQETVSYVSNIYKYYIAYQLVAEQERDRQAPSSSWSPRSRELAAPPPSSEGPGCLARSGSPQRAGAGIGSNINSST